MKESFVNLVKDAGIVGAGGAGFPTHIKVDAKAQYIIINGAECEPLLRVDQQLMELYPQKLLEGLKLVIEHTQAEKGYVALKSKYKNAVNNINQIIGDYNNISMYTLDNFYPAGDEQVLVYEVTKKIVPEGGIPLNVGVIVLNVETVLHIYEAYHKNEAVTEKYVTVTGEVKNYGTVKVPIGITIEETINSLGGASIDNYSIINGGPMMGKIVSPKDTVTKTTKGLIVLSRDHPLITDITKEMAPMLREARTACMHCSLCTEVCPRNLIGHRLEPHKLIRQESYTAIGSSEELIKSAFLCCECRLCQYACVMNLKPWQINSFLKAKMSKGGIRNSYNNTPERPHPFREYKKFPVTRLIAKLGLTKYDKPADIIELNEEKEEFNKVSIALKQHIGVPATPIVQVGDDVNKGQLIADIPESKIGSKIHASISGIVNEINNNTIIIVRSV
mgnify:CR=1 FL=1